MHRLPVLLLGCAPLAVAAVVAAPAPFPKPVKPWVTGWDTPVDPRRDCRFDRKGDKLTITVPGKGHGLYEDEGAPRLLREVGGDFGVQVRVDGNFGHDPAGRPRGFRGAGICVTDGRWFVSVTRTAFLGGNLAPRWLRVRFHGEDGGEKARLLSREVPPRTRGPNKV